MAERARRFDAERAKLVSGAELGFEIDAFLASRSGLGLSKSRLGWWLFKSPSGVDKIRRRKFVGEELAKRVRDFISKPDPAAWKTSYFKSRKAEEAPSRAPLGDRRFREFRDTKGASGTAREASSAEELASASRITDRAPIAEPPAIPSPSPAAPRLKPLPQPKRDIYSPPAGYETRPGSIEITEDVIRSAQARQAPKRTATLEEAQRRIDQGLGLGGKSVGVHIKIAQRSLEQKQAQEARLSCPIETAKTVLRRHFTPVVAAEYADPPGPKGKYLVGRQIVDEAELLRMAAEKQAA